MGIDPSCSCLSNFHVRVAISTNELANAQSGSDELMSQSAPCPEVVQNQESTVSPVCVRVRVCPSMSRS